VTVRRQTNTKRKYRGT